MRITLANNFAEVLGGTEAYLARVSTALMARGHMVTLAYGEELRGGERIPADEYIVCPKLLRDDSHARPSAKLLRRGVRALAPARPDIIYLHNVLHAVTPLACAEVAPVVKFVHDHTVSCVSRNRLLANGEICQALPAMDCLRAHRRVGCHALPRGKLSQAVRRIRRHLRFVESHRNIRHFVTASAYVQSHLLRLGVARERTSVLPYYVEEQAAPPVPDDLAPLVSRGPFAVALGRIVLPDKGFDVLVRAWAHVPAPFPLVIVGDGPAVPTLAALAGELGIGDRVHFTGWRTMQEASAMIAASAFVIVPSFWPEPFGLLGPEAMMLHRALVATEAGGIPEWLAHETNGLLVPRSDPEAFAAAINRLRREPGTCRRLGDAGYGIWQERYSPDAHLEPLLALLRTTQRASAVADPAV